MRSYQRKQRKLRSLKICTYTVYTSKILRHGRKHYKHVYMHVCVCVCVCACVCVCVVPRVDNGLVLPGAHKALWAPGITYMCVVYICVYQKCTDTEMGIL